LKHKLTDEEYTLLSGLCNGMDYASIAVYMDCSESTVFRLQKDALKKMKAKNKIHGVAIFSREEKFIDNH